MKGKRTFTLIELLVVIGVIAILMAMLLPAIGKVRVQAKKAKARAQIKAIEIAVKSYETTYGLLPASTSDVSETTSTNNNYGKLKTGASESAYAGLFANLTCETHPAITGVTASSSATNTRRIRFLDIPEKYSADGFVDPWGKPFVIFLDVNYVGYVKVGSNQINRTVAIYSYGPNKQDDGGDSSGNKDDISSWSE